MADFFWVHPHGQAWPGMAPAMASPFHFGAGPAWPVWHGMAGLGLAWPGWPGMAGHGPHGPAHGGVACQAARAGLSRGG